MPLPPSLRRVWNGWKTVSRGMGIAVSFILLSIVWLFAFGLYALGSRCGKWILKKETPSSSWQPVPPEYPNSMDHGF